MKPTCAGVIFIAFAACTGTGQTTAPPSAFEVASIKPSGASTGGPWIEVFPGGRFTAKNVTLRLLIQQAYDLRDFQVSGGPGWGPSEADMLRMTDTQRTLLKEQMLAKVQVLLADRFQLKVHRETRELPVYALTVAKNGPKVRPGMDDDIAHDGVTMRRGAGGDAELTGTRVSMATLAKILSNQVGRTVLDQTGLQGNYDFKLTFASDLAQPPGSIAIAAGGPSIFTAVQEQLGLKLHAQEGPVEVVVIDSAQKASEN